MSTKPPSPPSAPSLVEGRLCIVAAAILWSLSGGFTKLLRENTGFQLNEPAVAPLAIAFWRVLFAGLVLLPTLRHRDFSFRPLMVVMVICFATMNVLFVSALSLGTAANAIFLQYTAPMWMYLASVLWLGETADRRSSIALAIGLAGIGVIISGGWNDAELGVIAIALGSGFAYAGVMICLRVLRYDSSRWLTVVNHLCSALVLIPLIWMFAPPTWPQLGILFLFGSIQMALPYWLVARGLRSVSPQEAGAITLLEPILNPLWTYLVSKELPSQYTWIGGAFIVGALAWRYWPNRSANAERAGKNQTHGEPEA